MRGWESHPLPAPDRVADQQLTSEDSGKVRQNPQPRRNPKRDKPTEGDQP